jgi:hypothetical protein
MKVNPAFMQVMDDAFAKQKEALDSGLDKNSLARRMLESVLLEGLMEQSRQWQRQDLVLLKRFSMIM